MITQTFVYDNLERPLQVTSTIQSPAYTAEDRALLTGLRTYEAELCRCGVPRSVAWHSEMDGFFEADRFVCHACTAKSGSEKKVIYSLARDTRDPAKGDLPPFVLGMTTSDS